MNRIIISFAAALGCSIAVAFPAFAHATLEQPQAAVGGGYKAVMRIPHGCEGSATLKVRISVPEGVIAVKPQVKPGWTIETVKGKYAKTYQFYGHQTSEGVKEVTWTGNLPDEFYDEFVLNTFIAADLEPGTTLYFPTIQECEKGVERWIEIPEAGKSAEDLEQPAPSLKLLPKN